ncbi:MAG: FliG C-terminal domain-containing protein [Bdellovibrionales bacterium]
MSSLHRYRKSGGFIQLVSLIETFGPQKKEKFLEMIEAESSVWAQALREKMLTFERIFSWPEQVMVEVFKNLPPKTLAFAINGLKEDQKEKVLSYFSHSEKRKLEIIVSENVPKPEEVASTLAKVVEHTRAMLKSRELHAERFDESLLIPEDFEVKLEELATQVQFEAMTDGQNVVKTVPASARKETSHAAPAPQPHHNAATPKPSADVIQLQSMISQVLKENKALKEEVTVLRQKLEAIRKIS